MEIASSIKGWIIKQHHHKSNFIKSPSDRNLNTVDPHRLGTFSGELKEKQFALIRFLLEIIKLVKNSCNTGKKTRWLREMRIVRMKINKRKMDKASYAEFNAFSCDLHELTEKLIKIQFKKSCTITHGFVVLVCLLDNKKRERWSKQF